MSVRSQSAFLRKAGTLTVWLIIFCIYFLGVYNYVQIRMIQQYRCFCPQLILTGKEQKYPEAGKKK